MLSTPSSLDESLKALSNPARVRILRVLSAGPLTVNELCEAIPEFRQPFISKQLATLRHAGLVTFKAEGVVHTYRVNSFALLACVAPIVSIAMNDGGDSK
jgi:DNA-binding transcriptional ArsR family regulator